MTLSRVVGIGSLALAAACASSSGAPAGGAPEALLGAFEDDYDNRHDISAARWLSGTDTLHVVAWEPSSNVLLARDGASPDALWVRIDWVRLDGGDGWLWGWCMTVWDAPTKRDARSAPAADRSTPRTGCNGNPFTRMRSRPG